MHDGEMEAITDDLFAPQEEPMQSIEAKVQ
jgi:hypothetical protein